MFFATFGTMKLSALLLTAAVLTATVVFASGERGSPAAVVDTDVGCVVACDQAFVLNCQAEQVFEALVLTDQPADVVEVFILREGLLIAEPAPFGRWRCQLQDTDLPSALKPPTSPHSGTSSDGACGTI